MNTSTPKNQKGAFTDFGQFYLLFGNCTCSTEVSAGGDNLGLFDWLDIDMNVRGTYVCNFKELKLPPILTTKQYLAERDARFVVLFYNIRLFFFILSF